MDESTVPQQRRAVDLTPLAELERDLGGQAAVEIVMAFLEELPRRLDSVIADDPSEVRRAAHALKSSAALVGAEKLSRLAKALESGIQVDGDLASTADQTAAELRGWVVGKFR